MIEFAKILGELDNNMLQVMMRTGESLFAPFAVMGTAVSIPSEKWVKDNKDKFLALVTYEKNIFKSPIIIGFYPVEGANSSTYNTHERLIAVIEKLLKDLSKARVNTQIGPQKFMPDTQLELEKLSSEVTDIKNNIKSLSL